VLTPCTMAAVGTLIVSPLPVMLPGYQPVDAPPSDAAFSVDPPLIWIELELDELLQDGLAKSPLFATYFRENAARALLLPRRRPGQRTPLWAQRRRATDLLSAASRFPEFPILLETFRECLRDVFDVPGLKQLLAAIGRREMHISWVNSNSPSPFAASLLFAYAGNFIYDTDAPLAERRAQALLIDQAQLRDLLGEAEIRHLLDETSIVEVEQEIGRHRWHLRHADDLHDLLAVYASSFGKLFNRRISFFFYRQNNDLIAGLSYLLSDQEREPSVACDQSDSFHACTSIVTT